MDAIFGPMFDYLGTVIGFIADHAAAWWPTVAVLAGFVVLALVVGRRSS